MLTQSGQIHSISLCMNPSPKTCFPPICTCEVILQLAATRKTAKFSVYTRQLPSEKYFTARTNESSASFFLLSFSAILRLLLLLRLVTDWSLDEDRSESDKFSVSAIFYIAKIDKHRVFTPSLNIQTKLKSARPFVVRLRTVVFPVNAFMGLVVSSASSAAT